MRNEKSAEDKEMITNKLIGKAAIVAVTVGLVAVSAHAGPPRDSGRPVIDVAQGLCAYQADYVPPASLGDGTGSEISDQEIFDFACGLLWKTNGTLIESRGCTADAVNSKNYVTYTGRNCDKNEAAQERKAASVVLSMADVIDRNKAQQVLTAADYACTYASKAFELVAVGKLDQQDEDLIDDAEAIADALGYGCE
jgi:hypothetical protein